MIEPRLRGVKLNRQTLQGIDFEAETAFYSAIHNLTVASTSWRARPKEFICVNLKGYSRPVS